MEERVGSKLWFPLWVDKWLFGSTRHELIIERDGQSYDLRGVFVDLLCLAAKDRGFIRANPVTPYPLAQLAGLFCVPPWQVKTCIELCLAKGGNDEAKLVRDDNGVLYFAKWEKYQFGGAWSRRVAHKINVAETDSSVADAATKKKSVAGSATNGPYKIKQNKIKQNTRHISSDRAALVERVLVYFNMVTGQHRTTDSGGMINARAEAGATFEDFKHVIDTKYAQWHGDAKMVAFIRPSTLFRPGHFEDYRNEPYQCVAHPPKPKTDAEKAHEKERTRAITEYVDKVDREKYAALIKAAKEKGDHKKAEELYEERGRAIELFIIKYDQDHKEKK